MLISIIWQKRKMGILNLNKILFMTTRQTSNYNIQNAFRIYIKKSLAHGVPLLKHKSLPPTTNDLSEISRLRDSTFDHTCYAKS